MSNSNNPLLTPFSLPKFSAIQPEHVQPAVEQAIQDCRNTIDQVLANNQTYTWQNFIVPMDQADDRLGKIWSPVSHMNSVVNSEALRNAYEACLPLLSDYSTFVGQHEPLFNAYQQLANSSEFGQLDKAQQKVITNALRDFKLSGIALNADDKQRYGVIVSRLSELSSQFSNHILDATQAFTVHITEPAELAGLPESALAAAEALAQSKQLSGYLFSLDIPSYLPVMMYCDNRALREQMYRAYVTRASELGPNAGEFDNSPLMAEILQLRHELAQLLGFANYAEKSIETKMANSTSEVLQFLEHLAVKSKAQAERDYQELIDFARTTCQQNDVNAWDLAYYSEKLKQHRYTISDEQLRPYFPEPKVVNGLFEVVNRLYGVNIKLRAGVDVWHSDVKFYDVFDQAGLLRGSFYLDLYAREHKRGGAWMDDCVGRRALNDGSIQLPVAYLTCNFNRPLADKPALFTHDEVITLFHEFGHGMHHMMTQINASGVSGINGVPWDAVELPSQFLENWRLSLASLKPANHCLKRY
jgi:oligopeptidase A